MSETVPPRRIFLTGAAGRLGSLVLPLLRAAGHHVVPTDVRTSAATPDVQTLNLVDHAAVKAAMQNCDTVVHLGNHSSQGSIHGPPQFQIFNENCAMTMNVFDIARHMAIRKIIYASTIQVIASEHVPAYTARDPKIAYLPLDENSPPDPTNGYALSKLVGETILQQWASELELQAVSLRFPWLINFERADWRARHLTDKQLSKTTIAQGFSWLSYNDAAQLVAAIIPAKFTGHRIYIPTAPNPRAKESIPELVQKYYPHVPLKAPPLRSFVDIAPITRDTGWIPRDIIFA